MMIFGNICSLTIEMKRKSRRTKAKIWNPTKIFSNLDKKKYRKEREIMMFLNKKKKSFWKIMNN